MSLIVVVNLLRNRNCERDSLFACIVVLTMMRIVVRSLWRLENEVA